MDNLKEIEKSEMSVLQDLKKNVGHFCFVYTLGYLLTCFTKLLERVFFQIIFRNF